MSHKAASRAYVQVEAHAEVPLLQKIMGTLGGASHINHGQYLRAREEEKYFPTPCGHFPIRTLEGEVVVMEKARLTRCFLVVLGPVCTGGGKNATWGGREHMCNSLVECPTDKSTSFRCERYYVCVCGKRSSGSRAAKLGEGGRAPIWPHISRGSHLRVKFTAKREKQT